MDVECAICTSLSLCSHIAQYYPRIAGTPIIYFQFDTNELPLGDLKQEPSEETNDVCHHSYYGLSEEGEADFFKNEQATRKFERFYICTDEEVRLLQETDLI